MRWPTGADASGGFLHVRNRADQADLFRAEPTETHAIPVLGVLAALVELRQIGGQNEICGRATA